MSAETTIEATPLIVALHGGGFTSRYFDLPGASLLDRAAANGFRVVALDRPGYSEASPDPMGYAEQAEVLDGTIATLWKETGRPAPGVVVIAHSIGGAIAVHLAARHPSWPLLGIAIDGIATVPPAAVAGAWESIRDQRFVNHPPEQVKALLYGPPGSYDEEIAAAGVGASAPAPTLELLEVVGGWPEAAPALAARVEVPVHYRMAEHETLWEAGPERVAAFAALFTRSPFVDAREMAGTGHNIDHHHAGLTLHLEQLAFALRCAEASEGLSLSQGSRSGAGAAR